MLRNSLKILTLNRPRMLASRRMTVLSLAAGRLSSQWQIDTKTGPIGARSYSKIVTPPSNEEAVVDQNTYEIVCDETLESLCEVFEEIVDTDGSLRDADVVYGDGVLTVKLGGSRGTYVINRQSPNRQIWLSSPTSGPKRYDFVPTNEKTGERCEGFWLYKHDGRTLHELLQEEIPKLVKTPMDFCELPFGKR